MSKKKGRHPKLKKKEETLSDRQYSSDENFAFIAGFTYGGAPYGNTHEEMAEIEKLDDKTDKINNR